MDNLMDDHEREEAVKKWWHEHWKPITLGIVLTLAGLVGLRQYQAYRLEQQQATAYEVYQLQNQLNIRGINGTTEAEAFLPNHQDVLGAVLALDLARVYIDASRYDKAQEFVAFAQQHGGDLIAPQASLVLARLQCQNKNYDAAIATVDSIKSEAYQADAAEIKGDILVAKRDFKGAHDAYLKAIERNQSANLVISPILQMKFDNLIAAGDTPAYKILEEQNKRLMQPQAAETAQVAE